MSGVPSPQVKNLEDRSLDTTLHIKPELYRLADVCAVLSNPSFPEQVRLSRRAVRWRRAEIEAWARSLPPVKRRSEPR